MVFNLATGFDLLCIFNGLTDPHFIKDSVDHTPD